MTCAHETCARPVIARGLCTLHYQRLRAQGDPGRTAIAPRGTSVEDRIVRYTEPAENGCIRWTGAVNNAGYGKVQINGRTRVASRVVWELIHGAIAPDLFVCHRCDNPPCVNIDHLFIGSPAENAQDMVAKGRKYLLRGEAHHNTNLTAAEVAALRLRSAAGEPAAQLARAFGVSPTTVRRIATGQTWTTTIEGAPHAHHVR